MTAAEIEPPQLDAAAARNLTDRIKVAVEGTWHLIVEAYHGRAWLSLGYTCWDDYATREFGTSRLRLPREERAETVQSLRDAGLSYPAIAAATGLSVGTVHGAINPPQVFNSENLAVVDEVYDPSMGETVIEDEPEPKPITGIDGKTYHRPQVTRKPPRKPLVEMAKTRGFALRQATDALMKLFEDDRYRSNEKQVADVLRGHLLYVAENVAAVLDQLP